MDIVLLAILIVVLLVLAAARISLWVAIKLDSPSRLIPTSPVTKPGASTPPPMTEDELAILIRASLNGLTKENRPTD